MTPEQKKLIWGLVDTPQQGVVRISKEEFLQKFPSGTENGRLATGLLTEAERGRNAEDLQAAMIVGSTFGCAPVQNCLLCNLIEENWHHSHEDVVSALQGIGFKDQETIDALYRATQIIPAYLEYDEARALAVKAIWALGKIEKAEAVEKLKQLAKSDHLILKENAVKQLKKQRDV